MLPSFLDIKADCIAMLMYSSTLSCLPWHLPCNRYLQISGFTCYPWDQYRLRVSQSGHWSVGQCSAASDVTHMCGVQGWCKGGCNLRWALGVQWKGHAASLDHICWRGLSLWGLRWGRGSVLPHIPTLERQVRSSLSKSAANS